MLSGLDIVTFYRRLLSRWMWVLGAALLGGLLGLLASTARPPLYEASAILGIAVDRTQADVPDDITERQAYDRVRGLLLADDTLDRAVALAVERAGAGAVSESADRLRDRIRLSERPDGWVLAVAGSDPVEATRMAQAWADASLEQLRSASYHAIRAAAWQSILYEASCRLVPAEAEGGPARWSCRSAPPQGGSEAIPASILSEVEASRGILPVLSYSLLKDAAGASRPVAWGRGPMVLGGALVGLIVGCLIAGTWVRRPGQAA